MSIILIILGCFQLKFVHTVPLIKWSECFFHHWAHIASSFIWIDGFITNVMTCKLCLCVSIHSLYNSNLSLKEKKSLQPRLDWCRLLRGSHPAAGLSGSTSLRAPPPRRQWDSWQVVNISCLPPLFKKNVDHCWERSTSLKNNKRRTLHVWQTVDDFRPCLLAGEHVAVSGGGGFTGSCWSLYGPLVHPSSSCPVLTFPCKQGQLPS